jgi:hypothetical protein
MIARMLTDDHYPANQRSARKNPRSAFYIDFISESPACNGIAHQNYLGVLLPASAVK